MNLDKGHWIVLGLLVATSLASLALAGITLSGFATTSGGDHLVASSGPANLTLVLMGALTLLGAEAFHIRSRHPSRYQAPATVERVRI